MRINLTYYDRFCNEAVIPTDDDVKKFNDLYEKRFGERLSTVDAREQAQSLLSLVKASVTGQVRVEMNRRVVTTIKEIYKKRARNVS